MAIEPKKAQQLVEDVFTFDNVGDTMMAVRKAAKADTSSLQTIQNSLTQELLAHALRSAKDDSPETLSAITKAVEDRVRQYVEGVKATSSGCSGTPT